MTSLVGVIETKPYLAAAERLMSEEERAVVVDTIAANPEGGGIVPGTGGLRKLRIALRGAASVAEGA